MESIGVADLSTRDDHYAAHLALDRAGFADLPEQLPDGLATRVGTAYTGGTTEETGGVTVLVSHRLSTARMTDRIVYLDAGRVLEAGTTTS